MSLICSHTKAEVSHRSPRELEHIWSVVIILPRSFIAKIFATTNRDSLMAQRPTAQKLIRTASVLQLRSHQ